MLKRLKKLISILFIKKILTKKQSHVRSFSNFFSKAKNILVLLPENDVDFKYSVDLLKSVHTPDRSFTIFIRDFRVSLLVDNKRIKFIDYGVGDENKLGLPGKRFRQILAGLSFEAVLDLNRDENLFASLAARLVNAPVHAGFKKPNADLYYNIQIENIADSSEISYKNFLNCLQMF